VIPRPAYKFIQLGGVLSWGNAIMPSALSYLSCSCGHIVSQINGYTDPQKEQLPAGPTSWTNCSHICL